ncbi:unnamed protein product [Arabidopsis lyrata]|nr:unnamed protein product [Arabidopsis lyrata]
MAFDFGEAWFSDLLVVAEVLCLGSGGLFVVGFLSGGFWVVAKLLQFLATGVCCECILGSCGYGCSGVVWVYVLAKRLVPDL